MLILVIEVKEGYKYELIIPLEFKKSSQDFDVLDLYLPISLIMQILISEVNFIESGQRMYS